MRSMYLPKWLGGLLRALMSDKMLYFAVQQIRLVCPGLLCPLRVA
jgi:hypothetical protein